MNRANFLIGACAFAAMLAAGPVFAADDAFDEEAIVKETKAFFGGTTEGLAKVVRKVFEEQGQPNAYILGEEVSGAIGVGLRYGKGQVFRKNREKQPVFWQGPSIGFDLGGNASKVFVLIYNLKNMDHLYQRIPGVEGTYYIVAGAAVNYQKTGDLILAPIRTGVGLRGGVNIGYLHYGRKHSWLPF